MSGTSDWALRVTRKASACIKLRTDASWRTIIAYLVQCTKLKPVELEAPGLDSLGMRAPTLNLADLPRYSTEGATVDTPPVAQLMYISQLYRLPAICADPRGKMTAAPYSTLSYTADIGQPTNEAFLGNCVNHRMTDRRDASACWKTQI